MCVVNATQKGGVSAQVRFNQTQMVGLRQRGVVIALVAATALVISACGNGSADPASRELSQEADTYLEVVAEISDDFGATFASIDLRMQQTYATREALLTAVADGRGYLEPPRVR